MTAHHFSTRGLTNAEVISSRAAHGRNKLTQRAPNGFVVALKNVVKEPMFILLLVAATIYFISGELSDALFMTAAIVIVATISIYQDSRSRNALEALKELTQPM